MSVLRNMPDGKVLRFPDGTPQEVINRTMMKVAGLSPDETGPSPEQVAHLEKMEVARRSAETQSALVEMVSQLVHAVDRNREEMSRLSDQVSVGFAGIAGKVSDGFSKNAEGMRALVSAFVSEKEIIEDDKGNPIGVRVKITSSKEEK